MRYYSDLTHQIYETKDELISAEKSWQKKVADEKALKEKKDAERATKAKAVEEKYKEYVEANRIANKFYQEFIDLRNNFVKEYGSFHMSFQDNTEVALPTTINDLFDHMFSLI